MTAFRHPLRFVMLGVLLALIVGVAPALAAPVVADSYPDTNYTGSFFSFTPTASGYGQSFTAIGGTLDSAKFLLWRKGEPTGVLYATVWAHTGTYGTNGIPTGSPLATSEAVGIPNLPLSPPDQPMLVTFTFDNTLQLMAGTHYVVTVWMDSQSVTTPNDYACMAYDDTSPTHPGNMILDDNDGSFGALPYDAIFYVYENGTIGTPASAPWSLAILTGLGLTAVFVVRRVRVTA
jgi:hypothetical protein